MATNQISWSSVGKAILAPETAKCFGIEAGSKMAKAAFTLRKIALFVGLGLTGVGCGLMLAGAIASGASGAGAPVAIAGLAVTLVGLVVTVTAGAGYELSKQHAKTRVITSIVERGTEIIEELGNTGNDACRRVTGYSWAQIKTGFWNMFRA